MENMKEKVENRQTNKIKDLIKNTIIIFIGKASTQLISFLLLPLYTSYIITSEYGYVDLVTTYVALIVLAITLELDLAAFRFLIDYREDEQGKQKIITNVFLCLIVTTIIFVISFFVINIIFKFEYANLILLMIISNAFSSIMLQFARGLGKNLDYSIACIIGGLANVVLNVILIIDLGYGGKGLFIAMAISNITISLYLIFKLKIYKMINFKFRDRKTIKKLLRYSIPLIPNQISWWIIDASDRTIVSIFLGVASNGIYSIANKIPTILNGVYSIFHLSWSEQASIHFEEKEKEKYFSTVVNNGIKIFGSLCLIIISVLPIIFNILINQNYADAYYQIPIILLGIFSNIVMSLIAVVYVAKKMSKELAKTSTIAAIINIIINLSLIKFIGLYAASVSTFVSYTIIMVYRWIDVKKYISIKLDKRMILKFVLAFIISIYFYYMKIYNEIVFGLTMIVVMFINKENLKSIVKSLRIFISKK